MYLRFSTLLLRKLLNQYLFLESTIKDSRGIISNSERKHKLTGNRCKYPSEEGYFSSPKNVLITCKNKIACSPLPDNGYGAIIETSHVI